MSVIQREQLMFGCAISLALYAYCVASKMLPYLQTCWTARSTLRERWNRWRACTSQSSALDEHVSREVERRYVDNFQKVITVVSHSLSAFLCSIAVTIVNEEDVRLSEAQVFTLIVTCACATIGSMVPSLVNRKTLNVWYATMLLGLSVYIFSTKDSSAQRAWHQSTLVVPLRMLLSINCLSCPMIIAFNCIYSIAATYAVSSALNSSGVLISDDVVRIRSVIVLEVVALFATLYLATKFAASLRKEILYKAEATRLRHEGMAMKNLLDVMCDVVIELDHDGLIADDSNCFAAMFAMNSANGTKGTNMQDLMPFAEDRKRVDDLLLTISSNTQSVDPRLTHVTLRDSYGMQFRAELFLVHFNGLDSSSRYYVGIQESRDVTVAELRRTRSPRCLLEPPVSSAEGDHLQGGANLGANETDTLANNTDDSSQLKSPCGPLLYPQFEPTTQLAQFVSLVTASVSWNFVVPPQKCCAHHAAMDEVLRIAKLLVDGPCNSASPRDFSAQCTHCGILDNWDAVCDSLQCSQCNERSMTRGSRFTSL